jgi:F420-0:gamma-glutamyl ligase
VKATRKWIAELTTDLVSKGFTVLAVMNPGMHPLDQATGVIDLFDGEISITQSEDPQEC